MFFAFKVNAAIAKLGVSVLVFTPEFRSAMQKVGKSSGNTPQEVALHMVTQLPLMHRCTLDPAVVQMWAAKKLIDRRKPEVLDAIMVLALWDLV